MPIMVLLLIELIVVSHQTLSDSMQFEILLKLKMDLHHTRVENIYTYHIIMKMKRIMVLSRNGF